MNRQENLLKVSEEGEMREIKFRAWISSENIFSWDKKKYPSGAMFTGFSFSDIYSGHDEANVTCGDGKIISEPKWDKIILMQYTGLKDKNGKEIYEGDILVLHHSTILSSNDPCPDRRIVMWDEDASRLCAAYIDGNVNTSGYTFCKNNASRFFEIIGNVHETPELIDAKA